MTSELFGATPSGERVEALTLRNGNGVEVRAITYGAIITSLEVPDRSGVISDVVLGFDSLDGYLREHPYFGAVIGRYCNRIAKARFALAGKVYSLTANNGPNHLHGGRRGFDQFVWRAESFRAGHGVSFTRLSVDGEQGYPGNLSARVSYELTDANELIVEYHATTDKPTPVCLTQHSYFNLAGHDSGDVRGHVLTINASRYLPVDETLIPTGELAAVADTPFDFSAPSTIAGRIDMDHPQLAKAGGYDHNWILNKRDAELTLAAVAIDPSSGRKLEVTTSEPGLQFYSGNFLDGTLTGKNGGVYQRRAGFCLETQHFPDSPNQPQFPSTILEPGREYKSRTVFTFGVAADSDLLRS